MPDQDEQITITQIDENNWVAHDQDGNWAGSVTVIGGS
jgi:hypothetical protein